MSAGLMCLRCRRYIRNREQPDVSWPCECADPQPSWDGKTPAAAAQPGERPEAWWSVYDDLRAAQGLLAKIHDQVNALSESYEALEKRAAAQPGERERAICRRDSAGAVDDVVISCDLFRMERMDRNSWWVAVYRGGRRVCFGLTSAESLRAVLIVDDLGLTDDSGTPDHE